MDVLLTLILTCSVHFDDTLVQALASKLSIDNRYFVGDLSNLETYDSAHSVAEAMKLVDAVTTRGGRAAVGYLAVPVEWAPKFGRTVGELFDGCTNIGIATAMLSEYDRACSLAPARKHDRGYPHRRYHRPLAALRSCILRRLEIDLNITGVVQHLLPELARLEGRPPDPDADSPPARAALFPDGTDNASLHEPSDWSSTTLFAPSPTAPSARVQPAAAPSLPTTRVRGSSSKVH